MEGEHRVRVTTDQEFDVTSPSKQAAANVVGAHDIGRKDGEKRPKPRNATNKGLTFWKLRERTCLRDQ